MPELSELQFAVAAQRRERGFTSDPARILVLLVEEIGEIARELKKTWSPNYGDLDVERLGDELADVFVLLSALASAYEIDLASAVQRKFFEADAERRWPSAEHR